MINGHYIPELSTKNTNNNKKYAEQATTKTVQPVLENQTNNQRDKNLSKFVINLEFHY